MSARYLRRISSARPGVLVAALLAAMASCKEVRVTSADVSDIVVSAPTTEMTVGQTAQFSASVRDVAGRVLKRDVVWTSDRPSVASVSVSGVVGAVSAGTAVITATAEGRSDAVTVVVEDDAVATVEIDRPFASVQVGDTLRLTATARSADGTILSPRPINWTTTDFNVAEVAIDGLVTAKAVGSVTITASVEGIRGEASITVNAALVTVSTVRVEPASASLTVGDSVLLRAIPTASDGSVIPGRRVIWTTNTSAVASVDSAGRVHALSVGTARITATVDGVAGDASITVSAVPRSTISVTPTSSTLALGNRIQMQAVVRDPAGNVVSNPALQWSSSDAAVASVDAAGLVTARGVGIATVTVAAAGVSATATVFVVQQPIAAVAISPVSPTVQAGDSVLLTALAVDANGTPLTNRLVTWSTRNPAVAVVTPTGPATQQAWLHGVDGGSSVVSVVAETRSDSTVVTVVSGANLAMSKTAPFATVKAGDTIPFSLQLTNQGPSSAAGVVVTDTLPANAVFIDATGGPALSGNVLTWPTLASLQAGGVQSYTVRILAPASGVVTNTGAATTTTAEIDPANNRASASVSVSPPDLIAKKSAAAAIVNAADTIVYTIEVANAGPSPAVAVTVTDTLPANAKYVDATGTPTVSSTTLTWQVASLAVGASVTYTVRVVAPSGGSVTNVVTVRSPLGEANPADNVASVTVGVNALSDLQVTKTASAAAVDAAGTVDYTIVVRNIGLSAATAVVVSDTLPANAVFVSASGGPGVSGRTLVWPATPMLAPGDSLVYGVRVTAPVMGTFTNIATAVTATGESSLANNAASVTTTVNPANVSILKTGPAVVAPNDPVSYTIRVTNNGPGRADGVVVSDVLPAGDFVGAGGPPEINGVVTWPTLSLPAGQSQDFILQMTAPATGPMVDVASVVTATADPVSADNTSQFTTIVALADLSVTKSGPPTASAGDVISYTLEVVNHGPTAAQDVILQDSLPIGGTVVGVSITPATQASDLLTWGPRTLDPGETISITVEVEVPATPTSLTNIALIGSSTSDPDLANNRSTVTTTVSAVADLAVNKTATPQANPGQAVAYTINVSNAGPSDATAVVVADTLPAGVTFVSASGGGIHANGTVTWTIATLPVGSGPSFTVDATAPSTAGTYTNIATVASATTDDVPGNNIAMAATTVTEANLAVSKVGPATATALDTLTYTVTVQNNGPSPATSVIVTDTLPVGATFVSASPSASQSGNVLSWSVPSLAVLEQSGFTVRMIGPSAGGSVTNAAAATSSTFDPDLADNYATASTPVTPAANLEILKSASAPQVQAGDTIVYTIDVSNLGPSDATGVVVTDALPGGTTFVDATGGIIETSPGVLTSPPISLVASTGASYSVRVVAPAAGIVINSASVAATTPDPVPANNSATATTTVAQANLDMSVTAPASVTGGGSLTYTITVVNEGPGRAVGVSVQTAVPIGTTFVSATGGITPDGSGNLTWSEPAVALGQILQYDVTVTAPLSGVVTMSATTGASSVDQDPTNNSGGATTVVNAVAADLDVVVTSAAAVAVSDPIEYTIVVTNKGPGPAIATVTTFDLPSPSNVTFQSATGSAIRNGQTLTWPAVQIASGQSVAYTVLVTADRAATVAGTATTGSSVSPDPNGADNISVQQTVIT